MKNIVRHVYLAGFTRWPCEHRTVLGPKTIMKDLTRMCSCFVFCDPCVRTGSPSTNNGRRFGGRSFRVRAHGAARKAEGILRTTTSRVHGSANNCVQAGAEGQAEYACVHLFSCVWVCICVYFSWSLRIHAQGPT